MVLRYSWPAVLWSLVILVLTLIPGNALPDVGFFQIDKVVHFFIFGLLMILSSFGITKTREVKGAPANPILITSLYSITFSIMIEILQKFIPGRNFSVADIIANVIGVGLGYLVFFLLKKRNIL